VMNISAIQPSTGLPAWSTALPRGFSMIAGVSTSGPYVFVLASYSQWRGCAAPTSTLFALNATNGAVLNSMRLNRYPDMGGQDSGALFSAVDPSSCPSGTGGGDPAQCTNVQLYWRETLGWGTYNSYITAASFAGGYFLITTRYDGSTVGTNLAHDDEANPVRGCPPYLDTTPGKTGSLVLGPYDATAQPPQQPYMLVVDWAGIQVFADQQPVAAGASCERVAARVRLPAQSDRFCL
jgi:hypothetical protein